MTKGMLVGLTAAIVLAVSGPAGAQIRTVDPNAAGDLAPTAPAATSYGSQAATPVDEPAPASDPDASPTAAAADAAAAAGDPIPAPAQSTRAQAADAAVNSTYAQDDVLSAAEGVFGKGAEGLAKLIEKIFAEQGRPNGYIAGREAGGAIVVGVRYGSGTLFHKVEGQMPIYWTGPSLGFDLGANGSKSFVLVYNLYDTADIFRRYPAVEGTAYIVGGFTATYLRRGDVVLIPIRLGVGWRLGVNVGYMNFTRKSKALPF